MIGHGHYFQVERLPGIRTDGLDRLPITRDDSDLGLRLSTSVTMGNAWSLGKVRSAQCSYIGFE